MSKSTRPPATNLALRIDERLKEEFAALTERLGHTQTWAVEEAIRAWCAAHREPVGAAKVAR